MLSTTMELKKVHYDEATQAAQSLRQTRLPGIFLSIVIIIIIIIVPLLRLQWAAATEKTHSNSSLLMQNKEGLRCLTPVARPSSPPAPPSESILRISHSGLNVQWKKCREILPNLNTCVVPWEYPIHSKQRRSLMVHLKTGLVRIGEIIFMMFLCTHALPYFPLLSRQVSR